MPTATSTQPLQMELPSVSFFGRTLQEYSRFFALDPAKLRGDAVLDVAGGPASFTAEAGRFGIDAVAVDPLYQHSPDALALKVREDYAKMFAQMRAKPRLLRFKSFTSIDAAEIDRRAAAQRFLHDYAGNVRHGRYVRGALPLLPFLDEAFSLVLCAHLLFIYALRFDYAWHLDACVELMRVSSGEVRIHPVCGPDGRPYPALERLCQDLLARGIRSEIVRVEYEFFAGAHSMLILRRDRPVRKPAAAA
ncbi:MAG TPA: methyltransferase [Candidatus Didemnitutus sp.]|nr:methyltransferase [Candidatus Didemnitutus sp.]